MKLTVDDLKQKENVYAAVEYCRSLYPEYPERSKRPTLAHKHTAAEAKEYSEQLAQYENGKDDFLEKKGKYETKVNEINSVLETYIKEMAGIDTVPEQYRDKLWWKAWEQGHSSGYIEVYGCLCDLIDIFN